MYLICKAYSSEDNLSSSLGGTIARLQQCQIFHAELTEKQQLLVMIHSDK